MEKNVSVKLLAIVIIVFKRYPSTHCSMQGSCVICSKIQNLEKKTLQSSNHKHFYIVIVHTWFWWGSRFGCGFYGYILYNRAIFQVKFNLLGTRGPCLCASYCYGYITERTKTNKKSYLLSTVCEGKLKLSYSLIRPFLKNFRSVH